MIVGKEEAKTMKLKASSYRMGWKRTFLLALGAFAGVIITAYIIHLVRRKAE